MAEDTARRIGMIRVEEQIKLACPRAEVFAFMADLANAPRWVPDCVAAAWVSEGPIGPGSIYRMTNRFDPTTTHDSQYEITGFEPGRLLAGQGPPGWVQTRYLYLFEEDGAGTQLMARADGHLDDLALLLRPILKPLMVRSVRRQARTALANLKALLDTP